MIGLLAGVLLGLARAAAASARVRPPAGASPHRVGHAWASSGTVCPLDGQAAGMDVGSLEQSDPFSAGLTRTEVPVLAVSAPTNGDTRTTQSLFVEETSAERVSSRCTGGCCHSACRDCR